MNDNVGLGEEIAEIAGRINVATHRLLTCVRRFDEAEVGDGIARARVPCGRVDRTRAARSAMAVPVEQRTDQPAAVAERRTVEPQLVQVTPGPALRVARLQPHQL